MKKSPLISIAIRNGAIAGVLAIVLLLLIYYAVGKHPLMVAPFLDFRIVLLGIFIFFTLKEFRESYQDGILHFWQGMAGSFIMVMITATLASVLLWIFSTIDSGFVTDYVQAMTEYLKSFPEDDIARIGKDAYQRNLESLPSTNGKQIAASYFVQSVIIGFFVSIIISVISRKQSKPV